MKKVCYIVLIIISCLTGVFVLKTEVRADTLKDYFNTGDDSYDGYGGNYWKSQTFTAGSSYFMSEILLKLGKRGNPGGNNTEVILRLADANNFPTGDEICATTRNTSTFTDNTNGEWELFPCSATITENTKYNISWGCQNCSPYNDGIFRFQNANGYAGGKMCGSSGGKNSFETCWNVDAMFETMGYLPSSSFQITSPATGTTTTSPFAINFNYSIVAPDNWNKAVVVFENWATSTCPIYGTSAWEQAYRQGYYLYQSSPYYSDIFSATTGSSTIAVSNLPTDNYNCVYCYFYNLNNTSSNVMSGEMCPGYTLTIGSSFPAYQPPPIQGWQSFYASNTILAYTTSTDTFIKLSGVFNDLALSLSSFVNQIREKFDANNAYSQGSLFGSSIPIAFAYLDIINDFFSEIPIYQVFLFCLIVLIVVSAYRITKTILQLFRG